MDEKKDPVVKEDPEARPAPKKKAKAAKPSPAPGLLLLQQRTLMFWSGDFC